MHVALLRLAHEGVAQAGGLCRVEWAGSGEEQGGGGHAVWCRARCDMHVALLRLAHTFVAQARGLCGRRWRWAVKRRTRSLQRASKRHVSLTQCKPAIAACCYETPFAGVEAPSPP
jgi:hypothetical protein